MVYRDVQDNFQSKTQEHNQFNLDHVHQLHMFFHLFLGNIFHLFQRPYLQKTDRHLLDLHNFFIIQYIINPIYKIITHLKSYNRF
jgi:hypothetical protein